MDSKEISRALYDLRVTMAMTRDLEQLEKLKQREKELLTTYKQVILQDAYTTHHLSNDDNVVIQKKGKLK